MKFFYAWLLLSVPVLAYSQTVTEPAEPAQRHLSIADFGLAYPLSNDWVRATEMLRNRQDGGSPQNHDILLAAVYVPKSSISATSPFFSLNAYRQPATDCKKSLEEMIAGAQASKEKTEGTVVEFMAAGRDYFRVNMAHGTAGRHQCMICTTAKGHLLVWNAGASNEKGVEEIVATLNSITVLPERSAAESTPAAAADQNQGEAKAAPSRPVVAWPSKVRVSSGVSQGLLLKRVAPLYPSEARSAYIQGTVVLRAEISQTGDITDIELLDGPIELAGSAVAAVRQWKYRPYLLQGRPVTVDTQIQVNYQLRP
jgi:TonB family protein